MNIAVPGRGIAFLIPLSSIGGRKTLQYLTAGQTIEIEEESTLQNTDYELLVTIANGGHIETIMDAARSANAPGGTVIHAKGTGAEHAKRFLGISLAEEKEMIFIVVKTSQKQAIMKSIMERPALVPRQEALSSPCRSPALQVFGFSKKRNCNFSDCFFVIAVQAHGQESFSIQHLSVMHNFFGSRTNGMLHPLLQKYITLTAGRIFSSIHNQSAELFILSDHMKQKSHKLLF